MKIFSNYIKCCSIALVMLFAGCSKSGGGEPEEPVDPPQNFPDCRLTGISQVNGGGDTEFSITASFDNQLRVTGVSIYDSASETEEFVANFNYITNDSIRLGENQYVKLDMEKRVAFLATVSDLADPQNSDRYFFEYTYNSDGCLSAKNMYINGSAVANFRTTYFYTNKLLTGCEMRAVSSGNQKVLESTIVYDHSMTIKNWLYTFPDAMEGTIFPVIFNFGIKGTKPLKEIVTKVYNPATSALLDTWTTNYGGYVVDANGCITYGVMTGDFQNGISSFYGKTKFYYKCP